MDTEHEVVVNKDSGSDGGCNVELGSQKFGVGEEAARSSTHKVDDVGGGGEERDLRSGDRAGPGKGVAMDGAIGSNGLASESV